MIKKTIYVSNIISAILVPLHFFVDCEFSQMIMDAASLFLLSNITVYFFWKKRSLWPIFVSMLIYLGHIVCVH